ncbi:MAG: hypothetical protein A2Y33_10900 [Spirochaetes bacterium GWF1_51_8]|nr:MAG: hypothetical protein A2Y33_10900 [Spirochaetes bacterium GWF1_51_8]
MKRGLSVFMLVIVFCSLLYGVHYLVYFFLKEQGALNVKQIIITNQNYVNAADVAAVSGVRYGELIFNFDLEAVAANVAKIRMVDYALVERIVPDTIKITVYERKPVAVISDGKTSVICDRNGQIISAGTSPDLPTISLDFPLLIVKETVIGDEFVIAILRNLDAFERKNEISRVYIKAKEGVYFILKGLSTLFYIGLKVPDADYLKRLVLTGDKIKKEKLSIKYVDIDKASGIGFE